MDYKNEYCKVAAKMLHTEPGLLDYRLIECLNEIDTLVRNTGGNLGLRSRQVIALAIVQWQNQGEQKMAKIKRSWKKAIREVINFNACAMTGQFYLVEIYEYESTFSAWFPKNNHIKAKIRQVLQQLRDEGEIDFLEPGIYRLI